MGLASKGRKDARLIRKSRIRKRITGTDNKPRLCVYKSLKYTYVQLVSDINGAVLASASTKLHRAEGKSAACVESAKALGGKIAEIARDKKIDEVVFDRSGYIFHGRVAAVAAGAREAGLKF